MTRLLRDLAVVVLGCLIARLVQDALRLPYPEDELEWDEPWERAEPDEEAVEPWPGGGGPIHPDRLHDPAYMADLEARVRREGYEE